MPENQNLSFLDSIAFLGTLVQFADYEMNLKQISNDKLFEELQRQNKVYLETIIKNQNRILSILENSMSANK